MPLRSTTPHGGEADSAAPAQAHAPSGREATAHGGRDGDDPAAVPTRPPPGRSVGDARAGEGTSGGGAGAGETVLMAEDDPIVRMVAADVLREAGYRVLEAPDGLAALDVVRSGERVDLLLTDMGLPGLDGRRLAEAARRLRPGLRVLFVTGEACDAAGAGPWPPGTRVIGKPVALDVLAAEVRAMLAA